MVHLRSAHLQMPTRNDLNYEVIENLTNGSLRYIECPIFFRIYLKIIIVLNSMNNLFQL